MERQRSKCCGASIDVATSVNHIFHICSSCGDKIEFAGPTQIDVPIPVMDVKAHESELDTAWRNLIFSISQATGIAWLVEKIPWLEPKPEYRYRERYPEVFSLERPKTDKS